MSLWERFGVEVLAFGHLKEKDEAGVDTAYWQPRADLREKKHSGDSQRVQSRSLGALDTGAEGAQCVPPPWKGRVGT